MNYDRGLIAGSFDILHPGYVRMFREAKEIACRHLIVALQDDPTLDRPSKLKPVQSWQDRREILESIKWVDEIWYYSTEQELLNLIGNNRHSIDVRILGSDYIGKSFTGDGYEIPVYYCERNHEYSTTSLKRAIANSIKS
jgi:glycerol-3-phosphate cytidylyltransferase